MTPLIPSLVLMGLVVVVALLAAALHWRARTPATERTPDGRPVLRLLQGGGESSGPRHPAGLGLGSRPELVWSRAQREQTLAARARAAHMHPVSGTGTESPLPRRPTRS